MGIPRYANNRIGRATKDIMLASGRGSVNCQPLLLRYIAQDLPPTDEFTTRMRVTIH